MGLLLNGTERTTEKSNDIGLEFQMNYLKYTNKFQKIN